MHEHSADGTELWTRRLGTDTYDAAFGIAAGDGVYVTGRTQGAFDGGTGDGGFDVFLRKYSLAGEELWTRQLDVALNDDPYDVAVADRSWSWTGPPSGAAACREARFRSPRFR